MTCLSSWIDACSVYHCDMKITGDKAGGKKDGEDGAGAEPEKDDPEVALMQAVYLELESKFITVRRQG